MGTPAGQHAAGPLCLLSRKRRQHCQTFRTMSSEKILGPDDEDVISFTSESLDSSSTLQPSVSSDASVTAWVVALLVLGYLCVLIWLTWRQYRPQISQLMHQTAE